MIAKTLFFSALLLQCIYGLAAYRLAGAEFPLGYGYGYGYNGLATPFGFDGIGCADGPLGYASGIYGYGGLATPFAYDGLAGRCGYGAFGLGPAII